MQLRPGGELGFEPRPAGSGAPALNHSLGLPGRGDENPEQSRHVGGINTAGFSYRSHGSLSLSLYLPVAVPTLPGSVLSISQSLWLCVSFPLSPCLSLCPHIRLLSPLPCLSVCVPVLICHSVLLSVNPGPFPPAPLHGPHCPVLPLLLSSWRLSPPTCPLSLWPARGLSPSLLPFMSLCVSAQGSGLEATH